MDFPFFSSHEIWRYLSTSQIGFYTHRTSKSIPNKPGIYAWFLPLDIDDSLESVIHKNKSYLAYDSENKSLFERGYTDSFQWQGYDLEIKANTNYRKQSTIEEKWLKLKEGMSDEEHKMVRQLFSLGSILSKPLYIDMV